MANRTAPLLPATEKRLQSLGERLRLARLRRRLSAKQVAERAGMTPKTLRVLERGSPGATIGAYASVMQVLGVESDLDLLAQSDPLGRDLQDSRLDAPHRVKVQALQRPPPQQLHRKAEEHAPPEESKTARPARATWVSQKGFEDSNSLAELLRDRQHTKRKK